MPGNHFSVVNNKYIKIIPQILHFYDFFSEDIQNIYLLKNISSKNLILELSFSDDIFMYIF